MAQMSDYLENALINHVYRNIPMTSPATVYLALYSTDPTDADTGIELENGTSPGYARIAISMGAPVAGTSLNDAEAIFAVATGNWVPVTHTATRDALTGGNMLQHDALASAVSVLSGNSFRAPVGQFDITFG